METRVEVDNHLSTGISSSSIPISDSRRSSSSFKRQSIHRIDRLGSLSGQAFDNNLNPSSSSPLSSSFPSGGMASNGHSRVNSSSNPASRRESLYNAPPSIWDSEPVWM